MHFALGWKKERLGRYLPSSPLFGLVLFAFIFFLSLSFFVYVFGYEEKELDPEGIFLSVKSSVYERAKHMLIVHIFRAGEIGQRARYPENLIIGAS